MRNLIDPDAYFARVNEVQSSQNMSGQAAWEAVEQELQETTGLRKFLEYECFRVAKGQHHRQRATQRRKPRRLTFYLTKD